MFESLCLRFHSFSSKNQELLSSPDQQKLAGSPNLALPLPKSKAEDSRSDSPQGGETRGAAKEGTQAPQASSTESHSDQQMEKISFLSKSSKSRWGSTYLGLLLGCVFMCFGGV